MLSRLINKFKTRIRLKKKQAEACRDTGWSESELREHMEFAKSLGISNKTYLYRGYWNVADDKLETSCLGSAADKNRRKYAKLIAERDGLNIDDIEAEMLKAKRIYDLQWKYFEHYNWHKLTEEQRDSYFLLKHSHEISVMYREEGARPGRFNIKKLFYKTFEDMIGRKWFECTEDMTFEELEEKLSEFTAAHIIYKPDRLSGGKGVEKFAMDEDHHRLYEHAKKFGPALIEECVVQHEDIARLCDDCVNTVRTVTVYKDNEPHIMYAAMRMGSGDGSPVDNVARGGMCCDVDAETGITKTPGLDKDAKPHRFHPSSNIELPGYQLPMWDEVIKISLEACERIHRVAGLGYAGWDIAITPNGPVFIEGNNNPEPGLIQIPNAILYGKGMKYLLDDYIK